MPFRNPLEELLSLGYDRQDPENLQGEQDSLPLDIKTRRLGGIALDNTGTQSHPMMDRLMSHLNSMPDRGEYKPSFLQSLLYGAIGTGEKDPAKGYALAESFRDRPYLEALDEWGQKEKGLERGADLESRFGDRQSLMQQRLASILNQQQRTGGYLSHLGSLEEKAKADQARQAAHEEAYKGNLASLAQHRQSQETDAEKRLRLAEEELGLRQKHEGLYAKNINSLIGNRGKAGTKKPLYKENDIHTMAVGNVLRDNPEYASVVDSKGNPNRDAIGDKKSMSLLQGFNSDLERQKAILRNRFLGSDLQRPVFASDDTESPESIPKDNFDSTEY